MRPFEQFICLIFVGLTFNSCSKESEFTPVFSVDITADSFAPAGGTKTINLTSNVSWSGASSDSWLMISPSSGSGSSVVTLSAEKNNTGLTRQAVITLTPQLGDEILINVSQTSGNEFSVNTRRIVLKAIPDEVVIKLNSNRSWEATTSADWLTVTPGSGSGDASLVLSGEINQSGTERSAVIKLTPDFGDAIEISVVQASVLFFPEESSLSFSDNPGDRAITLKSDLPWRVTVDSEWLSVSPESGDGWLHEKITFTVSRNTSTESREAVVIFTPLFKLGDSVILGDPVSVFVTQSGAKHTSDIVWYVSVSGSGNKSGRSDGNAADFLDMVFWSRVNEELKGKSVEVIFLPGDYKRAYTDNGINGLTFDRMGDEINRLTLTGGDKVLFTVPEGYANRSNLIRFHGSQNIHFRDFHFTGNGSINYVLAIRTPAGFPPSQNILIENCSWVDMGGVVYGATGCHYEGTTNITYRECTFKRIGSGSGAHMMYHAYGPTRIKVEECYFEDCKGDYVRFRDKTNYGIVKNSRFLSTPSSPKTSFINIPCFNDVNPGDEYFATNYAFTGNTFTNQGRDNISAAILFKHVGFSPANYNYLPTAEEAKIMNSGIKSERVKQFKINFGLELDEIRVTSNTYSSGITNWIALHTAAAYGSVSLGFQGTIIMTDLINTSPTPFNWEDSW